MNDQNPDHRAQLLDALDFAYCQGLGYDTPEALVAAYDAERGVPVPPPADQTALRDRIRRAVCEAEGFGWDTDMLEPDEYGEVADAVLAVLPEQTNQTAVRGVKAEALLLRFAAEAHRRKWSYDRGIDDDGVPIKSEAFDALHRLGEEMRVALEKLRRVAAEEQPAETQRPLCPDPIECGHEAALGQVREAITFAERVVETSGPGPASAVQAVIDRLRAANPDRPAVGEQPETQEARPECAHCWREIENRGTPSMGGNHHVKWVHVPGGFTVCFPQRGGDSPRAEPRTPE